MKIIAKNRRAHFDYEILETIEAGIVLSGQEAKSCRLGNINLTGSYVSFIGENPNLKNASISPYPYTAAQDWYVPTHDRKLLLSKVQSEKLKDLSVQHGISIIPLEVRVGRFIKILLGVGKGRKKVDKRQKIKERDIKKKLKKGEEY
jgi:SsrA-binding protein